MHCNNMFDSKPKLWSPALAEVHNLYVNQIQLPISMVNKIVTAWMDIYVMVFSMAYIVLCLVCTYICSTYMYT